MHMLGNSSVAIACYIEGAGLALEGEGFAIEGFGFGSQNS
jgi:hypothetical protein